MAGKPSAKSVGDINTSSFQPSVPFTSDIPYQPGMPHEPAVPFSPDVPYPQGQVSAPVSSKSDSL
jgi:hypothetical protein